MNRKKKNMRLLLTGAIALSLLAACSNNSNGSKEPGASSPTSATTAAPSGSKKITDKPITLKWYQLNFAGTELGNMGMAEGFQEIEKRTGIHIEWQHPATPDQINVMLASGDYPDVIFWDINNIPGGLKGLIDDGTAVKLNDLVDKYAPNYKSILAKYPDIKKFATMDDGTMPAFYQLDPDPRRLAYTGFFMRKDWLDKLGLQPPTTIDEWHTVLKAFKEKDPNGNGKADEIPYTIAKTNNGVLGGGLSGITEFATAWGVLDGFYRDPSSGKLQYGPIQPPFKDFLTTMNSWYKEGLIDSEYASTDAKSRDTKLQGDLAGATYSTVGGGLGNNTKAARAKNSNFKFIGLTPPVGPAGKPYNYTADLIQKVGWQGVITKSNKYPVETAKLLDYLYSEEGQTLLNWGIEGKSYTVKDGKKQFTDEILKNTAGKSPNQAISHYAFPINGFTKVMDFDAYSQINLVLPEQQEAATNWGKGDTSLNTPLGLGFSTSELSKLTAMMADINTYKTEMILKFIMGVEPLSNYDAFVKKLKIMGIDDATKMYQAAYDRFNARK
ncbi:type 2 periplasmic-binding domain-containing protein [Paenibacillus roseipurpureus]|uniref:Extracellular solute-binding protein n=1 Tax=Paenibacillus roseopurpureus TaxID=2918901 RepID=A0AA96RIP9_9BACL|nr:extracellular solute-binding protein [Paenibacillus sp. MBLB1832]WNR43040.1 extracellular solute-binding protein [Paenibacillus sp. MBLB1832]